MTLPPPPQQQHLTAVDHQYFEWSRAKQETNQIDPLMTYKYQTNSNQLKPNKTRLDSPITTQVTKKQKINPTDSSSFNTNNQSQTYYPFQAELTQKIDIECGNSNINPHPNSNQLSHPPTHHFTLSTVINVSVNNPYSYPLKSSDKTNSIPYSELNLSLYLKDIDLTTFDRFTLPSCPNPQDYLTVDGLLTFLMSPIYSRTQNQISQNSNFPQSNATTSHVESGSSSYYKQSYIPQQMTNYHSTKTSTSFR